MTKLIAFEGKFGQFTVYTAVVQASALQGIFGGYYADAMAAADRGDSPFERAQRLIDMPHVRRIVDYLKRTVRAFGAAIATSEIASVAPLGVPGVVEIELTDPYLVDGQKRIRACIMEHEANPDFNDSVTLMFIQTTDLRHKQQIFASINGTAAKVSSSLNAIYDNASALASFIPANFDAAWLECEKATVGKSSPKLVTPGIVKEALSILLGVSLKQLDSLSTEKLDAAWDTWEPYMRRLFGVYERLQDESDLPALRETSILPHNIGFLACTRLMPLLRRNGLPPEHLDKLIELHEQGVTDRTSGYWDGRCVMLGKIKKSGNGVDLTAAMLASQMEVELDDTLSLFL